MIMSYRIANSAENTPNTQRRLATIEYGTSHARGTDPRQLNVGLPPLHSSGRIEIWETESILGSGWHGELGFVASPRLMLAHRLVEETDLNDLSRVTFDLYRDLLAFLRESDYPHPLRIWNVIQGIHDHAAGLERYRAFSAGRARAFDEAAFAADRIPAASAIGSNASGLLVYALASRVPGLAIENPRQTPAYRYPDRYGPRPPYFARATRATGLCGQPVFISGTASIVGHLSLHPESLPLQTAETIRNLESLLQASGCRPEQRPQSLKVYLRHPHQASAVESALRSWAGPESALLFLCGDICRRDLDIEVEGLFIGETAASTFLHQTRQPHQSHA